MNVKSVANCSNKVEPAKYVKVTFNNFAGRKQGLTFMQEYRQFSAEMEDEGFYDSAECMENWVNIRFGNGLMCEGVLKMYSLERFGEKYNKATWYVSKMIGYRVHLHMQGIESQEVNKRILAYRKMIGAWNK